MIKVRGIRKVAKVDDRFVPIIIDAYFFNDIDVIEFERELEEELSRISRIFDIKDYFLRKYDRFAFKISYKSFYKAFAPITKKESYEEYDVIFIFKKDVDEVEFLGVRLIGITSCPCALEEVKEYLRKKYRAEIEVKILEKVLNEFPIGTHNQRNVLEIIVEVRRNNYEEILNRLLKIARKCFSAETYEVLKRVDEIDVVVNLSRNTNFVEDIIRKAILNIYHEFRDEFTDEKVIIRTRSFESIHKHDAYASKIIRFDKIRRIFEECRR